MSKDKDLEWIEKSGGYEWTPGSPWPPNVPDYIADVDDQRAHHFQQSKMSGESASILLNTLIIIMTTIEMTLIEKTHSLRHLIT